MTRDDPLETELTDLRPRPMSGELRRRVADELNGPSIAPVMPISRSTARWVPIGLSAAAAAFLLSVIFAGPWWQAKNGQPNRDSIARSVEPTKKSDRTERWPELVATQIPAARADRLSVGDGFYQPRRPVSMMDRNQWSLFD